MILKPTIMGSILLYLNVLYWETIVCNSLHVLQAMLKRLQTTKATKDLQRDKLLTNYNSTMIAGHSLAGVHQAPGTSKLHSPYESQSMTSLGGSELGVSKRPRPGSAKSSASSTVSMRSTRSAPTRRTRPQSGKRGAPAGRPEWESGWWFHCWMDWIKNCLE